MAPKPRPLFDRWDEKVERIPDGCWLWRGAIKDTGYGVIQRGGRGEGLIRVHAFAYEHYVGPIPEGLEMRHHCHVRHCVNPEHLTVGTRADNMQDSSRAGRLNTSRGNGADNHNALLSWEQADAIRSDSRSTVEIAAEYGIGYHVVWNIRAGHTYVR